MGDNKSLFTPEFEKIMEAQGKLIEERMKTLKHSKNAVNLTYVGEFDDTELQEISDILANAGLEFGWYNKSGIVTANLEIYKLVTQIVITYPVLSALLIGVGSNFVWETIKLSAIKLWDKLNTRKYNKISGGKTEGREITFGINVHLDKNTGFDFELKGNVSKEIISESLDKILDFLKEQQPRVKHHIEDYVYYNPETKQWVKIDVMEELIKLHTEKTSKPKSDSQS